MEVNRHWRHWHTDIIGAWLDRIQPMEPVIYDVVYPEPPRAASAREITLDIVIWQGLDAPRRAGLVTVLQRDDRAQRAAFAVGVSVSEVTSGQQIVQLAESLHECNLHQCSIRHGWNRIPFTMEPLHDAEAFYRTLRPLAVGGNLSDHCISLMCHRLRVGSDALHELHCLLKQPSALEDPSAPPHVQRMFQALHQDTWFQLGAHADPVRTEIGSRPGDSFADIVFGFLWAKLLCKLETALVAHGLLEFVLPRPFSQPGEGQSVDQFIPLLGPTWMDDLRILLTAQANAAIVSKAQFTMSLLLDFCTDFQLPISKKGRLK